MHNLCQLQILGRTTFEGTCTREDKDWLFLPHVEVMLGELCPSFVRPVEVPWNINKSLSSIEEQQRQR